MIGWGHRTSKCVQVFKLGWGHCTGREQLGWGHRTTCKAEFQDFTTYPAGGWMDGWVAGWPVIAGNNATSWLHLASWNLPDSQLS